MSELFPTEESPMKIALKTLSGFFVNLVVGSLVEKESNGMEDKSVSVSSIIREPPPPETEV